MIRPASLSTIQRGGLLIEPSEVLLPFRCIRMLLDQAQNDGPARGKLFPPLVVVWPALR